MDSEDKKVVWIVGLLLLFIIMLFAVIAYWHTSVVKTYVSNGYNRTTLPGVSRTYWVKDVND